MYEEFISHTIQQQKQQAQANQGKGKKVTIVRTSSGIQFTANTEFDTYFALAFYTSAATGYTLDWGDGTVITVTTDMADPGGAEIDHTYEEQGIYNCRLTFDDPSVVTQLEFPGYD